ncbi:MAG: DNA glycosylase AlkZ-like family protein [Candidatus Limnocylindria bacterium]
MLHDGFLCGTWRLERDGDTGSATLVVNHVERLTKRATAALAAEGRRLLRFVAADVDAQDVRFVAVD